jgi:flagellar protein FliS
MNAYTQHNQYLKNQVSTASREQILIMLYDGAIRFCKQAKQSIKIDNQADKGKYLGKAMAIITEFSNTLNHDIGGDIAANLDGLYTYMLKELTTANIKNDPKPVDTVCNILCELRAAWAEAIEINSGHVQHTGSTELKMAAI